MFNALAFRHQLLDDGLSVADFARKTGYSQSAWHRRMSGKVDLTVIEVVNICRIMGWDGAKRKKIFLV